MDGSRRGVALRTLAPHLPDHLLPDAVEVALTVNATDSFAGAALSSPRANVLTELAPRLQGPLREQALKAARAAVDKIDDTDSRNEATLRLAAAFSAPDLATADVLEAVTARIRDSEPSPWRDELVQALRQYLPTDLIEEVAAERLAANTRRAKRVDDLLDTETRTGGREPGAVALRAAFEAAQGIDAPELRAAALGQLAPYLTLLLEKQEPHDQTEDEWDCSRVEVLGALAPHLNLDQLPEAMSTELDLLARASIWSWNVLAPLAAPLATMPPDRLHPLWRQILHVIAPLHRIQTLGHLRWLGPVVTGLGEKTAGRELVRAVGEIGDWWP